MESFKHERKRQEEVMMDNKKIKRERKQKNARQ